LTKILVPLCVLGLCAGLFFLVFAGGLGAVVGEYKLCSGDGTWCIEPARYTYWGEGENVRVSTTLTNQSDKECRFDLGDGNTTSIAGGSNLTYSYSVNMNGNTTRYFIVKEGQAGFIREALTLKIQPFWKGGN
jgi:hypothetical protein